jgi:hypothetical protein
VSTLEIVHLRASIETAGSLSDLIEESLRGEGHTGLAITLYRRHGLATDVAVHIHRSEPPGTARGSDLAKRLAHALKEYGLVEHSVWEETS